MPSYHDISVIINGKKYKIKDSYAYQLTCTKVAGWCLYFIGAGSETLIGGEYDSDEFIIKVNDCVVCGKEAPNRDAR